MLETKFPMSAVVSPQERINRQLANLYLGPKAALLAVESEDKMRKTICVKQYMTAAAHSINSGLQVKKAKAMMKAYGVRHLPVQLAGHLVGVITERDLNLAESLDPAEKLMVDDAMTSDPYTVSPDASIGEVVEIMAMRKLGCAVVQDSNQRVIGIFTATDGLRALGDILNETKRKLSAPKQEGASQ